MAWARERPRPREPAEWPAPSRSRTGVAMTTQSANLSRAARASQDSTHMEGSMPCLNTDIHGRTRRQSSNGLQMGALPSAHALAVHGVPVYGPWFGDSNDLELMRALHGVLGVDLGQTRQSRRALRPRAGPPRQGPAEVGKRNLPTGSSTNDCDGGRPRRPVQCRGCHRCHPIDAAWPCAGGRSVCGRL